MLRLGSEDSIKKEKKKKVRIPILLMSFRYLSLQKIKKVKEQRVIDLKVDQNKPEEETHILFNNIHDNRNNLNLNYDQHSDRKKVFRIRVPKKIKIL